MGKFNRLLDATYTPPKKWVLNASLSFDCDQLTEKDIQNLKTVGVKVTKNGRVTVPKGFVTDMASVPRVLWNIIAPFDVARAAVIHDILYKNIRDYLGDNGTDAKMIMENAMDAKKVADKIFLYAMESLDPPIPTWKRQACYLAVKFFGKSSCMPLT